MKNKIVIKLGGSSLDHPATLRELIALVQVYREQNSDVVLVHGGGPAINQALTAKGIAWKFIQGQRQTTPEMMGVIEEVLGKQINGSLVKSLTKAGVPAVGLSGANDSILFCVASDPELMRVGYVEQVDTRAILSVLDRSDSATAVIAPIGLGRDGDKMNVNADWAATQIAIALNASRLIFLTDQNGILDQNRRLLTTASPRKLEQMIESGVISGGMRTKVLAMIKALHSGVGQICVLHASSASRLTVFKKVGTLLKLDQRLKRKFPEVFHGKAS